MNEDRLKNQIEQINQAFHKLWFGLLLGRPDFYSEKLRGLSFVDLRIMGLACRKPDLIMREIRNYVKIPQTTLSSIVAKLEKLGYVNRVINRRDMRSYSIMVTEKGREIITEHEQKDFEQAKKILMMLDEEEREEMIRILQKITSNL